MVFILVFIVALGAKVALKINYNVKGENINLDIDTKKNYENEQIEDKSNEVNKTNINDRRIVLENIDYKEVMKDTAFIDIRIRFPDGEDFVVLRNISIQSEGIDKSSIYTSVLTEKEILWYSSALSDINIYSGTRLYAAGGYSKSDEQYAEYIPTVNTINISNFSSITGFNDEEIKIFIERRKSFEERIMLFINGEKKDIDKEEYY